MTQRQVHTPSPPSFSPTHRHSPIGNTDYFGDLITVMRPSYARDIMLITPSDSYHYATQYPHCDRWPNCTAGTLDHSLHILKAWMLESG